MEKNGRNEELICNISTFLENAGCCDSASGVDAEGLPFETIDDIEILPIEYEEEQSILLNRAEDLFVMCQRYNRRSKGFIEACTYLDQSIRSLASVCITRVVNVKFGKAFPELHNLSTYKLFMMASFNFRKVNAAMEEEMREKKVFPMGLMGMLLRCHQTLERLRSTEAKIAKINTGEISASDLFKRSRTFTEKSPNKYYTPQQNEAPVFREAISFPIIKNAELGIRNAESGNAEGGKRNAESEITSEVSAPEVIETGEGTHGEDDRGSEETGMIIESDKEVRREGVQEPAELELVLELGNGETAVITLEMARIMLANPETQAYPELVQRLREFVNSS